MEHAKSQDARDGKTKEQRAKDHELRRLRRKVEQMERANGTRQSSTRRRSRSGSDVEGTESTTEHEPRRNTSGASNRGTRTSACNARSERRLDVTQTDSTKRGSNVSDGTPAFASRSRVSRASGTPSARSSDGASSIGAAASPVVAASVVDVEEPWGPKPDGEPKGLYGKYDGEEFQMFVPRPNVSRNENLVHFMMSATPPNVLTLCKITRIKARPDTSKRKPAYSLVLQSGGVGGEEVALIETKRTSKGKHIYYEFAIGNHFLGKLKCNLSAKKFTLFDGGVKVSKSGMIPVSQRGVEFREELASVSYIKTPRGPRQLVATIPSLSRTGSGRGPLFLVNKIPQWDADLKVHTLKYHHRATEKSVKNFQLMADCSKQEQPPVLLRFGKVASDTFNLDFRGPLTPLQAMAFAMTAFEKNWLEGLQ